MAQSKKKRRTKHRGTQAGTVESRGRTSRPTSRAQARQQAQQKRQSGRVERANQPPTWRSATIRAGVAAAVFLAVLILFQQPPVSAVFVAFVMFGLYIPMGYYTDRFLYQRRLRKETQARNRAEAEKLAKKSAEKSAAKKPGNTADGAAATE